MINKTYLQQLKTKRIIAIFTKTFLVLFFFTTVLFSQNYIDYTRIKYVAQDCILDEKFIEAQNIYDSLINIYDFVYALDCLHAIKVAITNNDSVKIQKFLLKGIEMGIPIETINEDVFIKKNLKFNLWANITEKTIDSLQNIYENRINKELARQIEKMDSIDDIATDKVNKSLIYYCKWRRVARKNAKELKEIIKIHGFPSEKIIGIKQYYFVKGEKMVTYYPIRRNAENMLIHYFSRKEKDWNEYRKLLFEQLESGNLQPESYGTFCDFYSNWRCWKKTNVLQLLSC